MTVITITTGSKREASRLAEEFGGEMSLAGLWLWKVTIHLRKEADLDAVVAMARDEGCTVTWL